MKEYFYEDFELGNIFTTRTRHVSGSEIELIVGLMGATNPLFLNREIAESKGFEGKITPGVLISAYAFGLEYQTGIYDNIIALVGVDEMRYMAPLLHGDPLFSELEVIHKRETSREDRGIVVFQRRCYIKEKKILEAKLTFLYLKRSESR
jgi:acyl dehydratase